MSAAIDSLIREYARRYSARDVEGVTELCSWPFVAIREGAAIHLADREAVRDHFAAMIDAYRNAGYASFAPVAIETRELGQRATFTTVRWQALDSGGAVARDTETTYHLLETPDGWRILSYTNHF
jgi:ketosteroid isomerase-like protein